MAASSRGAEWPSLLEKLPLDRAEKLLNELGESLSGTTESQGPQAEQYKELSPEDFARGTLALSDIFKHLCLSPGHNAAPVNEGQTSPLALSYDRLSSPYKEKLRQVVLRHEEALRLRFQRQDVLPQMVLAHFDWEVEVVVASSVLSSQETPLLRLSLRLQDLSSARGDAGGSNSSNRSARHHDITLEMQRAQLDQTIEDLEACLEGRAPRDLLGGSLKADERTAFANGDVQPIA